MEVHSLKHQLYHHISSVLLNFKSGTSEAAFITRDAALLHIVSCVAGLEVELIKVTATSENARPDGFCYKPEHAPFVLMEQKNNNEDIENAIQDLSRKFHKTEAYLIPEIPSIATAGDIVVFGVLQSNGRHETKLKLNLSKPMDRARAVVAAINIGRYGIHVHEQHLIERMEQPYNKKLERSRSTITITYTKVIKVYKRMKQQRQDVLKLFHRTIFPFVETVTLLTKPRKGALQLEVTPAGLGLTQYGPSSFDALQVACRCILCALHHMHRAGWVFVDLHWLNVIRYHGYYYLIDTEFVSRTGAQIPDNIPRLADMKSEFGLAFCTARLDLCSLAKMVSIASRSLGQIPQESQDALARFIQLLQTSDCTALAALQHEFLSNNNNKPFAGLTFLIEQEIQQRAAIERKVQDLGGTCTDKLDQRRIIYIVSTHAGSPDSSKEENIIYVTKRFIDAAGQSSCLQDPATYLPRQKRSITAYKGLRDC